MAGGNAAAGRPLFFFERGEREVVANREKRRHAKKGDERDRERIREAPPARMHARAARTICGER